MNDPRNFSKDKELPLCPHLGAHHWHLLCGHCSVAWHDPTGLKLKSYQEPILKPQNVNHKTESSGSRALKPDESLDPENGTKARIKQGLVRLRVNDLLWALEYHTLILFSERNHDVLQIYTFSAWLRKSPVLETCKCAIFSKPCLQPSKAMQRNKAIYTQ